MNFIANYISEEEYNDMLRIFGPSIFEKMDESNFWKIANFLKSQNISVIEDIVITYFPMFLIDYKDFIEKFEKLKSNYVNINDALIDDLSILEEIYE